MCCRCGAGNSWIWGAGNRTDWTKTGAGGVVGLDLEGEPRERFWDWEIKRRLRLGDKVPWVEGFENGWARGLEEAETSLGQRGAAGIRVEGARL